MRRMHYRYCIHCQRSRMMTRDRRGTHQFVPGVWRGFYGDMTRVVIPFYRCLTCFGLMSYDDAEEELGHQMRRRLKSVDVRK